MFLDQEPNLFLLHWRVDSLPLSHQHFPIGSVVKNLPATQEMQLPSQGQEDALEKEMATHSRILAWRFHERRSLAAIVYRVSKSWTWLKWLSIHEPPGKPRVVFLKGQKQYLTPDGRKAKRKKIPQTEDQEASLRQWCVAVKNVIFKFGHMTWNPRKTTYQLLALGHIISINPQANIFSSAIPKSKGYESQKILYVLYSLIWQMVTAVVNFKKMLAPWKKTMTNLDSILKSRDITLPKKVPLVKAMVFPVVMYGYKSWTIKKAECWRINAFRLWCWRRLLRVPWTARRTNQSIPKEISPEYSLEGLMLKLKV